MDPSLEPNVGAWAGSLPRRRLQASLSSKDTSFSLLKAQPSQLKPVGGLQFEMMQAMLREHGIQDEVEDSAVPRAASKGTSVKRARQNTSQSTREGPKLYEWMGDKDIDKLRRMTVGDFSLDHVAVSNSIFHLTCTDLRWPCTSISLITLCVLSYSVLPISRLRIHCCEVTFCLLLGTRKQPFR